ncbi:MAG: dCTP deaminase [Nitrospirae bacterium GWD2_57_9]|nr:MAG: dCTP deaminase [Nitrospirae bacterium GWD2_57_9]OGW47740.1 MAG: dCTP deaminase [Nitrospirae bacterium GWC2_57_9]
MSVLIGKEIEKALKNRSIRVEPLDKSQIGPGSIDLTLGNDFRIFKKRSKLYHVRNDSLFQDITQDVHVKDGEYIVIKPGEMILGITREKISLADSISGRLEGRSRFARFGLAVHVTAGFMHPGISNHQALEIVNLGHAPLALYPGTRICQFIFEKCDGRAKYKGRFAEQVKP